MGPLALSPLQSETKGPASLQPSQGLTHLPAGRRQFTAGRWTEGPGSSPVVTWKSPSVPCHTGLPMGLLTTWQLASSEQASQDERGGEREGVREGERGMRITVLYKLISEVTSIISPIIGSEALDPAHPRGGAIQRHNCWEVGVLGRSLRSCLPQPLQACPTL